ncbi:hypothetical protein JCM11251_007265 [Rhodosporidiobolus azoricus]
MSRTAVSSAASSLLSPSSSSETDEQAFHPRSASRDRRREPQRPRQKQIPSPRQERQVVHELTAALEEDPRLAAAMWGALKKLRRREGVTDVEADEVTGRRGRWTAWKGKERAFQQDYTGSSSDGDGGDEHPLMQHLRVKGNCGDEETAVGADEPRSRTTVTVGKEVQSRTGPQQTRQPLPRLQHSLPPSQPPPSLPITYPAPGLLPHKPRPEIDINFRFPTSFGSDGLPSYPHNQYLPLHSLESPADEEERLEHNRLSERQSGFHRRRPNSESSGSSGGILFPLLLSFGLILIPILILSAVLGGIFAVTKVQQ